MELTKSDLISDGDVAGAARMITEMTLAVLKLGRASVWLFETAPDGQRELVAVDLYEPDVHQSGVRFPERLCPHYCRCLDDHRLLAIEDAIHDDVTKELAEPYLIPCGITAVLDAPIYENGQAVGVVCQAHKGGTRVWTEEERFFAAALADIMALTLAHQRRETAKLALQDLEHRHRLAVEAGEIGVWSWHPERQSFWANNQFWNLLGMEHAHHDLFTCLKRGMRTRDRARIRASFHDMVSGASQHIAMEQRWEYDHGRIRWLLTKGQSVMQDGVRMIMGTTIDITERKIAEESQRRILESERSAQQVKDRFLANMSHELRTPLNGILGMAELLQLTDLNQEQSEYATTIVSCGKILLSTFTNMLDMTKLASKKIIIHPTSCHVGSVLHHAKSVVLSKALAKDITIMIEDKTLNRIITTDAQRLTQAVIAVTDNAIKFSPHDRMVVMTASMGHVGTKTMLIIDIQDEGPGISPLVRDRLFTPFATHDDSSTRRHEGTGLGLSIAKGLMHLLGGDVTVFSTSPQGTIMRIEALVM
jgi:PAS domain S-box-containing protein